MQSSSLVRLCNNYIRANAQKSFFKPLKGLEVVSLESGKMTAEMTLTMDHCNEGGIMAGAMANTILDFVPFFTLWTLDKPVLYGVSINMTINFLAPAHFGDTITIEGSCLKSGKKVSYLEMNIYEKNNRKHLCNGQHIFYNKFLANNQEELPEMVAKMEGMMFSKRI